MLFAGHLMAKYETHVSWNIPPPREPFKTATIIKPHQHSPSDTSLPPTLSFQIATIPLTGTSQPPSLLAASSSSSLYHIYQFCVFLSHLLCDCQHVAGGHVCRNSFSLSLVSLHSESEARGRSGVFIIVINYHINCLKHEIDPSIFKKPKAWVLFWGSRAAQVASVCLNTPTVPPVLQSDSARFNYKLQYSYFLNSASSANVNTISRKFCS